jgi:hypothetical protein
VVGLIIGGQIAECEESNPANRAVVAHCFGSFHQMVMHKTVVENKLHTLVLYKYLVTRVVLIFL